MLIAPELSQLGREMLIGHSSNLRDQREHRFRQLQPAVACQRDIGDQSRRARRPVDQRHALLCRQRQPGAQFKEKRSEGQDLAGPAV
jgi:hypothetical protein